MTAESGLNSGNQLPRSQGNRTVGGIAVLAVPFVSEIIFPVEFGFETSTPM